MTMRGTSSPGAQHVGDGMAGGGASEGTGPDHRAMVGLGFQASKREGGGWNCK